MKTGHLSTCKTAVTCSAAVFSLILTAIQPSGVAAQSPTCSSCNSALACNEQIAQIFMNEDGGSPTHTVRVCGPGGVDLPAAHATLLTIPANTSIDAVCIAARSTSQFTQPCEVFYAGIDPLTGHPDIEQGVTPFGLPPGGSIHQIIPVNWTLGGTVWVGVRFPAGACNLSEMGTRPRTSGDAAVWVSGSGWRDYVGVGAPGYGLNTPIIRPISSINSQSAPQIIVNTLGQQPLTTDENGVSFGITVALSDEPCDNVIIQINVSDPSEASANPSLLTFTPQNWNVAQASTIQGLDDPQVDGDIPYGVDVVSFAAGAASPCFGGQTTTIAAINEDNDVFAPATCPPPALQWNLHPPMAPPSLANQAMAYDRARERVVMFGGDSPNGPINETYEWDGQTWTLAHPGGPGAPTPRSGAKMTYDTARGVCVLVGGADLLGPSDETWEWDGFNWQLRASGPGASPGGPRHLHDVAYDEARGVTVVYGGLPPLGETWEWDGNVWTPVLTPTLPGAGDRHFIAMTYDPITQRILLFGGIDALGYNNDVWSYDGFDWSIVGTIGVPPSPRANASFVFDSSRSVAVLHGGDDFTGLVTDDTWELDTATMTWTQTSAMPPPRTFHAAAYDEARCETVLFGGDTGGGLATPETSAYPINLGGQARTYCVVGTSTGADWSWSLSGLAGGGWSIDQLNEPGLPAGDSADSIVNQWVNSINNAGCCTVRARISSLSTQCFEVFSSDIGGFNLCVGAAGAPPTCCVAPAQSCSFNPTIVEVQFSGTDCDGNGTDDGLEIALDPSLDANGDGILDICTTYLLGDMNCDFNVDGRDVQGFMLAITSPADYAATYPACNILAGDYDGDGIVGLFDLAAFVQDLTGP